MWKLVAWVESCHLQFSGESCASENDGICTAYQGNITQSPVTRDTSEMRGPWLLFSPLFKGLLLFVLYPGDTIKRDFKEVKCKGKRKVHHPPPQNTSWEIILWHDTAHNFLIIKGTYKVHLPKYDAILGWIRQIPSPLITYNVRNLRHHWGTRI